MDYSALNHLTKRNNEARFFSKLDLQSGFHQIRVQPEYIEKTALNTNYGHFEYLVIPMHRPLPVTHELYLYDCLDACLVVHMNDLLTFSEDEQSHLRHIELVFSLFKDHKLYLSPKKCGFMRVEMEFMGLIIGKNGLLVDLKEVEVLKSWPKSSILTDVRSFLCPILSFPRFIKTCSEIAAPPTNAMKKDQGIQKWKD